MLQRAQVPLTLRVRPSVMNSIQQQEDIETRTLGNKDDKLSVGPISVFVSCIMIEKIHL